MTDLIQYNGALYHASDFSEDYLAHYGVKGMKWGVRKDGKRGGRMANPEAAARRRKIARNVAIGVGAAALTGAAAYGAYRYGGGSARGALARAGYDLGNASSRARSAAGQARSAAGGAARRASMAGRDPMKVYEKRTNKKIASMDKARMKNYVKTTNQRIKDQRLGDKVSSNPSLKRRAELAAMRTSMQARSAGNRAKNAAYRTAKTGGRDPMKVYEKRTNKKIASMDKARMKNYVKTTNQRIKDQRLGDKVSSNPSLKRRAELAAMRTSMQARSAGNRAKNAAYRTAKTAGRDPMKVYEKRTNKKIASMDKARMKNYVKTTNQRIKDQRLGDKVSSNPSLKRRAELAAMRTSMQARSAGNRAKNAAYRTAKTGGRDPMKVYEKRTNKKIASMDKARMKNYVKTTNQRIKDQRLGDKVSSNPSLKRRAELAAMRTSMQARSAGNRAKNAATSRINREPVYNITSDKNLRRRRSK